MFMNPIQLKNNWNRFKPVLKPVDGEADEDDVGLGVRQGPEPVVGLLAGRVPQRELNLLPVNSQPENVLALVTKFVIDFHNVSEMIFCKSCKY